MKLKFNKLWLYIIEAFFTSLAFSTANRIITSDEIAQITDSTNFFIFNFARFQLNYLGGYGINISMIFIITVYFFYHINKKINISDKKLFLISSIGGFLLATFMTIGNRFIYNVSITDSAFQVFVTLINFMGYFFLFKNLITLLIITLKNKNSKDRTATKKHSFKLIYRISNFKSKHPILLFMILILICWLPYIIIFYPGTMNVDSLYEIGQAWGKTTWTTHHPVFITLIYANFMNLGRTLIDNNFGLFLNNITQILVGAFLLSYGINYIYKLTHNKKITYFLFAFFAFFPTWPIHFYTEVKDIWFSISFFLFVIYSIKFFKTNGKLSKLDYFIYLISMILCYLFRKNGVFVILLSFPFFALVVKKTEKIKIVACSIIAILFCMTITKIYTSANHIEKGSIGEALSIPLQQTSHYVHNYELTEEESKVISKIIAINDLKENFMDESVDNVKAHYKTSTATNKNLKDYLITWFKMFLKHPGIYVKATLNSTYGYFYPDRTEFKDGIAQYTIDTSGSFAYANLAELDIHFADNTEDARTILTRFAYMLRNMPLLGLFFSCGFYTWILVILTLVMLYFKKIRELVILIPLYVILLVCIASPVNAYVRYMLPIMMTLPFVSSWLLSNIRNENGKE